MIIEGGNGVRLLGYYSMHPLNHGKGLITLIHGWEGSSDSSYVLSTAKYLYDKGYEIFRLNLRDHGKSHHLNEGLFHGALIEETFQAVCNISYLSNGKPYYVVGFSLGGNFALRIAVKQSFSRIPHLKHVVSISPSLDPYKATLSIDKSPSVYRLYFLNKWKSSLRKKQELFPQKYDFADIMKLNTCMALTEAIMPYYPDFSNYREYFDQYTLRDTFFSNLSTPVTIIASEDDPIVPIHDFYELQENIYLKLSIHRYGGHCGFIDILPFQCWYEREIEKIFREVKENP
jgi:predicted alpha/beta-fold hydrolase